MAEGKIQFREDPELIRFVAERGLNPNEVARQGFQAEVRRMRGDGWLANLRELQKNLKPLDRPAADLIREMREERADRLGGKR